MTSQPDHLQLLAQIEAQFGLLLDVKEMIADRVAVGRSINATIFRSPKNQLWVYLDSERRLTLGDVQKTLVKMGVRPFRFCPPIDQPNYFVEQATERFKQAFPGKPIGSENELRYYKTLVPYSPALIQVQNVVDGKIHIFDADTKGEWRVYKKLNYSKIPTDG